MEENLKFTKEFDIECVENNTEIDISFSSESNVTLRELQGKKFLEVLKHSEGTIDFSRLIDGGLPLMVNHSKSLEDQIGRVENITLDPVEKKLRGKAVFADTQKAKEIQNNTKFFKGVSFGYLYNAGNINFYKDINGNLIGEPAKWTPFEVSIVAIPEDVTVGFNKSMEAEITENIDQAINTDVQETQIEQKTDLNSLETSLETNLDEQTKSITIIEEVKNMENQETKAPVTMPSPVDFTGKDTPMKSYSIATHVKGLLTGTLTGAEKEVAQELGNPNTIPTAAFAKAMNITTGNPEFNIPGFGGYLDLLLPQSALSKLGVGSINLTGPVNLPGAETPDYATVSEVDGSGASAGSVTSRDVNFFPKIAVAQFETSRVALEMATPGMESYLAGLMMKKHAADFEAKAIAQLISEITAGNTVAAEDTTNHLITADDLLALMLKVTSVVDLPIGSGFLTNWTMYNKLKTVKRDATLDRAINENGMIWDLPSVPSAHVAKVSTYDPVIFGAWSNALTASFGNGVNILVDPYTKAVKDQVVITGQAHWDAHLMDTKAFAKIVDAK